MTNERITKTLMYLFSALASCLKACQRTRELVKAAIAKFLDLSAVAA
jgi:hypothetical protein